LLGRWAARKGEGEKRLGFGLVFQGRSPLFFLFLFFFSKTFFSKSFLNRILRANKFQQMSAAQSNKDALA